ncbi:MAG TPA: DUF4097 family beta strand repeat-containing protein [Candidatus Acidoferrales bacterium]|jgi:DUF4097 and DUF4098 domain-containing protein YvlB|nr:DUF4097 family beta strand repeat-containing protein [Candidatus Acidoferrales bacterium]
MSAQPNQSHLSPACRAVMTAAILAGTAWTASATKIEKHFTVTGRPVVTVKNSTGRVEVKSWSKMEVMVVANQIGKNADVETEQAGSRVEINTRMVDESSRGADMQVDYQILVPDETELTVRTNSGSIVVESVHGDLTFDTIAADVNLKSVGGMVFVTTTDGSIVCQMCDGRDFKAETVRGNVELIQPIMDKITVHTTAGSIHFDGDFLRHGLYVLKSDTGNTEVRFGPASSFDLTARSERGSVISQANLQPDKHGKHKLPVPKYGNALAGTVGLGNAKVELSSFSGTIKILQRDAQ